MKAFYALLIGILCCFSLNSWAQTQSSTKQANYQQQLPTAKQNQDLIPCLTTVTPEQMKMEMDRDPVAYEQLKQRLLNSNSRAARDYHIQLHIVREDNGSFLGPVPTVAQIRSEIATYVNPYFNTPILDASFIECGPELYHNSTQYNTLTSYAEGYAMSQAYNVPNVINIYFVEYAQGACGWARFPANLPEDYIVILYDCATNQSTLVHELGHYFDIYHTHETAFGTENVERTPGQPCYDCNVDGDLLCDTEADPNLSGNVLAGCIYDGTPATGLCDAQPYNPDPNNIMSYSLKACRTVFTTGQQLRMAAAMVGSRSYLQTGFCCPDPTAVCQNVTVQLDGSGNANVTAVQVDNGSTAPCGLAGMSVSPSSFDCGDIGANTVMLTVTDVNGTTATCSAMVTVEDDEAPTIVCNDVTWNTSDDGSGDCFYTGSSGNGFTVDDNCNSLTVTGYTEDENSNLISMTPPSSVTAGGSYGINNAYPVGINTVYMTVTDQSGNSASCSYTVTVIDDEPPTAVCKKDTVYLDANGVAYLTASQFDGGSTDNCGIDSMAIHRDSVTCENLAYNLDPPGPRGRNVIYFTVWDEAGNTSSCFAQVTVFDTTSPTALCKDITVSLDLWGNASITPMDVDGGSWDNCYIVDRSISQSSFNASHIGVNVVTLTLTDTSGNTSSCNSNVTIVDDLPPTVSCNDATVQLDASGQVTVDPMSLITMGYTLNNSGLPPNSRSYGASMGDLDGDGDNDILAGAIPFAHGKVYFNDGSGNFTNSGQTLLDYRDFSALGDVDGDGDLDAGTRDGATGNVRIWLNDGNGFFTNTGQAIANSVRKFAFGDLDGDGDLDIFAGGWNVPNEVWLNDGAGNFTNTGQSLGSSTTHDVALGDVDGDGDLDAVPANFNGPKVIWLNNGNGVFTLSANTPPLGFTWSISMGDIDGDGDNDLVSGGNERVLLNDGSGVFTLSASLSTPGSEESYLYDVDSDCDLDLLYIHGNGGVPNTLWLNDGNGNFMYHQDMGFRFNNQAAFGDLDGDGDPEIYFADYQNTSSNSYWTNDWSVYDNVCIASKTVSPASFTCANIGSNTVILTVTDVNGNSTTCSATVTVEDTVPPTALCQNVTIQLDASGNASVTAAQVDNGSTDNCTIVSWSLDQTAFDCSHLGANTVTLTVTDQSGNTGTCNSTITVEDNIAPTAMCQNVTIQLDGSGNASISTAMIDNGSTDNCTIVSWSLDQSSFTCTDLGTNTVTLTVEDQSGNQGTCSSTVTVEDNTPPVAQCKDITVTLGAGGTATITGSDIDNGSTDNCTIVSWTATGQTSYDCSDVGNTYTVTLTVTDQSGNTATCTSQVTVDDVNAPVAECKDVTVQLSNNGNASITASMIDNGSYGSCGGVTLSASQTSFNCSHVGTNAVVLTVTDIYGVQATCSATVTVEDNIPPVAKCKDITIQLDAAGNASITASMIDGGSVDNCGVAGISASQTAFDCSHIGMNNVTLTVTDVNGNQNTCTAKVTVEDVIPPVAKCQPITVQLDANGVATFNAAMIDNGSTDECGIVAMWLNHTSFTCPYKGTRNVILKVKDAGGNISACTTTVTVVDLIPPTPVCQDITIQLNTSGNASITASMVDGGSTDNCGVKTIGVSRAKFDCSNVGANTVILTVTDQSGNQSTCSATVTVQDGVPPTAKCKDITVKLDASGSASITASMVDDGSYANCGSVSLSINQTDFDCDDVGANTVTLTVTDLSGNQSTCTATVTVEDNLPPTIVCPPSIALNQPGVATWATPTTSDNCGPVTLTSTHTSGTFFPRGRHTVVYTATDPSGNVATCSFYVAVRGGKTRNDAIDPQDEAANSPTLKLWPNPTEGLLQIDLSQEGYAGKTTIELYDLLGRRVHATSNDLNDRYQLTLDISNLAGGQYMLRIRMDETGEMLTRKVIVVR